MSFLGTKLPNIPVKALPSVAGTAGKPAAPYLQLQGLPHSPQAF
jgi:hypothetical protein